MTKRKIQFSLVYRDMFQSSGKFQPRKDQLERIAPVIIKMGCFARVETNGGAFEQVNLLYGENPNQAVRAFTKPFNEVGIKTHMLDRGLNALRMFPVPADVRKLMYKVKHAQGVDITRIFCGLNDVRNIIPSIHYALEAGMTPQATLCITNSPIHTAEYYANIADQLIEAGAPEICLKDMAGIGQPAMLGKLTKMIKDKHPEVIIEYHGHSGPGLSMATILEVCRNGADVIDTAIEPLSWGKVHPDVISVQSMLKHAGFDVPEINMEAYMEARKLTQEFIDDFLGYFMNPSNKLMSSLLLGCGLPGGMVEDGEEPREAVLRELQEELLLSEEQIHYLGDMDKLYTGSSLIMYSFAAEVTEYQNTFSPAEVGEVFRVPLEFFLHTEPKCYVTRARVEPGEDFPYELICGGRDYNWRSRKEKVCFYQYEGHVIWGLTAKVIRAFAEVVRS